MSVDGKPTPSELDEVFSESRAKVLFFGHYHHPVDENGRRRYINPGSLGLNREAVARYCLVDLEDGDYTVDYGAVYYEDSELSEFFEKRKVPEREFINRFFFLLLLNIAMSKFLLPSLCVLIPS